MNKTELAIISKVRQKINQLCIAHINGDYEVYRQAKDALELLDLIK